MGNLNSACWWPNCECQTEKGDPCKYEDPDFYTRKAGEQTMTDNKLQYDRLRDEHVLKQQAETKFLFDVLQELKSAREKFPSSVCCGLAMTEEASELAQAMLKHAAGKWPQSRIYEEAVQVAVMAMRCALEGDESLKAIGYSEPTKANV